MFGIMKLQSFLPPALLVLSSVLSFGAQQPSSAPKALGTIKSVSGNDVVLTTDAGSEVKVQIQETTRLVRVAPGQDLKSATPISLQDLQSGDRILVRGKSGDSETSLTATTVIAMKKGDIAQKHEKDLQDWRQRGTGGLVKAVDPVAGTVTITFLNGAGSKTELIKIGKSTILRRYSPNSVKFDDAKPGTLADIKPGDQLRARGNKNSDGTEMNADEVVSGTFRNVAGLITAVDTAKNTITVNDLSTKKPVTVRVTSDSQMHRLPPMMAQMMARRLKGGEGGNAGAPPQQSGAQQMAQHPEGSRPEGGAPAGGRADMAQMLNRLPPLPLAELAKGEAVMVVATEGSSTTDSSIVSLLSGVEPILTASPNGSGAASMLGSWSLSSGGGEGAGGEGPQ